MYTLEDLIDREMIRDVIAQYTVAFDDRDWETWETFWTDDTVFVVDGAPIEGLDAVRTFMQGCLPPEEKSKHMCSNPVIHVAGDRQSARVSTDVVWVAQNYENTIVARYVDDFVKRDGRWLIARRDERIVPYKAGPPPMSEEAIALNEGKIRPFERA
jgi:uncharacterized protein (TIGR02246 family)